jgi:DNA-binding MarR family transcriptional regulator
MSQPTLLPVLSLVERAHRTFMDALEQRLQRRGRRDTSAVQAMIVYHLGDLELTVGELTERGLYQGSNVSYNLKGLAASGYIRQQRDANDRRAVRISLTERGQALRAEVGEILSEVGALTDAAALSAVEPLRVLLRGLSEARGA